MGGSILKRLAFRFIPVGLWNKLRVLRAVQTVSNITEKEEPNLKILSLLVGNGDSVADIGANLGVYSFTLSKLVGENGRVTSVEPIPATNAVLRSVLTKLECSNVDIHQVAVTDEETELTMIVPADKNGVPNFYRAALSSEYKNKEGVAVSVQGRTLDSILSSAPQPVRFVKIDVEGHELSCIQSGISFLDKNKPALLIEISGNPDDSSSSAGKLFELIEKAEMKPYLLDGARLRKRKKGDVAVDYFFLTDEQANSAKASQN